ncbi:MFS transporter [Streptomyces carpaticus]|uniref:MDR family MFS transporter n=1 Tax=Streptomyces carpaticus TaxID=285558 RepID=UPI002208DDFD|nr:MFS transporter [Streptomyces carpaticus]
MASATPPDAPAPPAFTPREITLTMSGLIIAMLLAMLDNMIVAPALPTIVGDLGGLNHLAWVTTGYLLASTAATPLWGKLGDLYGRRITFLSAIGIFLLASVLAGLAQDMAQLIAFRALQGLGAGGLMVGVLAVIAEIVPPRERGKYQGMMMAVMPVAMIGGPLVGGFITDHLTWRWAFYVNLPLGLVTLVVCWYTLARLPRGAAATGATRPRIDWTGAALLTTWITALVLITSWGGAEYAWGSPQILGLAALTVAAFAAFVLVERRAAEPVMPLSVFRSANFTLAGALALVVGFVMFGGVTFLPQYQQFVQGSSATNSGLLLMPMMIAAMVMSLAGGQFISRTGRYRALPIAGTAMLVLALALFATIDTGTSRTVTAGYMVLLGLGMGCLMQTTTLIAQNSAPARDIGAATGAVTFLRNMGGSLGVSLLGALYTSHVTREAGELGGDVTQMTPELLKSLPERAREIFQEAVTGGVITTFWWAGAVAAAGFALAWFIRQVPLRGYDEPAPRKSRTSGEAMAENSSK